MNKMVFKLGLCVALVMGTLGQQALAAEIVAKNLSVSNPQPETISFGTIPPGQSRVVHGLILTNNDPTNVATVSVLKNSSAKTGNIKIPVGSTVQVQFPTGFAFGPTDAFKANIAGSTSVDLTIDVK